MTEAAAARLSFAFFLGGFTFFAPCAYPLLPGYVAYFLGNAESGRSRVRTVGRAVGIGLLVSAGFALVFAVLGGIVLAVGSAVLEQLLLLELVVGALLVVLGALLATGRAPSIRVSLPERRRSALGFVLFGVVYAVAAAGCTALLSFSVVASALAVDLALGVWTLVSYVAGMSAVMVAVTVLAGLGREALLTRLSGQTGRMERAAGVLLMVAGVAQMYLFLFRFGGLRTLGLA